MRVAVIGSGISGLGSAYLLKDHADVHVFEKATRLGGHSHTVDADFEGVKVPVDTGFIVYNPLNYPNLINLFSVLDVPTQNTDMSFAVSLADGRSEYEGSIKGLLAQPSNLLRRRYWSMLADLVRFYRTAPRDAYDGPEDETLGAFIARQNYGEPFVTDHLLPMGAAIWSCTSNMMNAFPVRSFMRFMENHKLLNFIDRPQWRTVLGGSREYVTRIHKALGDKVHCGVNITSIRRANAGVMLSIEGQGDLWFDKVIMAAHADESLALIADPTDMERDVLSAFKFQPNRAVLHSDARLMPRRKSTWAAWNYITSKDGSESGNQDNLCLTYWMNRLQSIDTNYPLYETLNPHIEPDPKLVHGEFIYHHPVFDSAAIDAQPQLADIQGVNNLFFAGAWTGYGFHEDGLKSAVAIAKKLGAQIPWHSDVDAFLVSTNESIKVGA
ncbi:FAD-dependent oxidoreductase [uncultured Candidatus Puniceispirillum sp.]|uniref:NAD(P)/FAD-dependent oxidoreductase n=1 Tax=uncultured Candidatus Puniceispirillum sp. TaxID=1985115 RepID=UPI0032B207D9